MKALAGIALVVAHAIAFVVWVPTCRRPELQVELAGDPANAVAHPTPEHARVEARRAGLAYTRYAVGYRGGFERSVGYAALPGPHQDPDKPACTGRVVVGQKLLDDGKAGPGTIAGELQKSLEAELSGESFFGAGSFEHVKDVSLRWAVIAGHPDDMKMIGGDAPNGYVRATVTLEFARLDIPLVVALIPKVSAKQLEFVIATRAEIQFGNRVLDWASDKLGGTRLATRLAKRQIDGALITALAPPPPFELPGGRKLTFGYCDGAPEIIDGVAGALPFSVAIGHVPNAPTILPTRLGPTPHRMPSATTPLAIDLDLDAANALLYELWRTGFLDDRLAAAGLDQRFNTDPTVQEFLSLRISSPRLALPPALGVAPDHKLALGADARITIQDGDTRTIGRVWGALVFELGKRAEPISVDLGGLELSCERTPTTLVPCYADLVGALRDRGAQFHGELTRTFVKLVDDIFVNQRVGASGLSADLVIRAATVGSLSQGDNGSLHIDLDAELAPRR